jgi:beta-glucosidase
MVGRSSADIRLAASFEVDGVRVESWHTGRPFPAVNADVYARVRFVDATRTAGDAVPAAAAGAWVGFRRVTFDPAVTRCTARLSSAEAGPATVVLRAGDPVGGPVIATLTVEGAGDHYAWRDAIVPVAHRPAGGPVDVYAVFAAPGVGLRELAFVTGE